MKNPSFDLKHLVYYSDFNNATFILSYLSVFFSPLFA